MGLLTQRWSGGCKTIILLLKSGEDSIDLECHHCRLSQRKCLSINVSIKRWSPAEGRIYFFPMVYCPCNSQTMLLLEFMVRPKFAILKSPWKFQSRRERKFVNVWEFWTACHLLETRIWLLLVHQRKGIHRQLRWSAPLLWEIDSQQSYSFQLVLWSNQLGHKLGWWFNVHRCRELRCKKTRESFGIVKRHRVFTANFKLNIYWMFVNICKQ